MKVRIVSVTQPSQHLIDNGISTAEHFVVYCARVSNPANQLNMMTAPKLIGYLIEHSHWSPFEMVSIAVEIETSRAIAAQILRHKSFAFQEYSQRYSNATDASDIELRTQAKTNRQSSVDVCNPLLEWEGQERSADDVVSEHIKASMELYTKLTDAGVARECARMVLPLATSTTMYMSGTLRSWIHYLQLRCGEDTQKEHRDIALHIRNELALQFPYVAQALGWNDGEA